MIFFFFSFLEEVVSKLCGSQQPLWLEGDFINYKSPEWGSLCRMGSAIWSSTLYMRKAVIFALWLGYFKEPSVTAKEKRCIFIPHWLGLLTLENPGTWKGYDFHWTDEKTEKSEVNVLSVSSLYKSSPKKKKAGFALCFNRKRVSSLSFFFLLSLHIRNFTSISFPFSERFYQCKLQVHVTGENRFLIKQVDTLQQFIPVASRGKK